MKAVALYSGGLDSILAIKLVEEQGVEVIPVHIYTVFAGRKDEAFLREAVELYGLREPVVVDASVEFLSVLKSPKFGYGSGLNPCIDCKIFFYKKAARLMKEASALFLVTGEVVGQRPMSQNKRTLRLMEREAGLEGLVLRPLSAKLLPETIPERSGWVRRDLLLDISGRGRKRQILLAQKYGLKKIPTPAGGCLLTDPAFSKRLKKLFEVKPDFGLEDVEGLKKGRAFWLGDCLLLVARNYSERDFFLGFGNCVYDEKKEIAGVVYGSVNGKQKTIAGILLRYLKRPGRVFIEGSWIEAKPLSPEQVQPFLIGG